MADFKMEAVVIFEPFLPNALRRTPKYTEDDDDDLYGYDAEYGMGGDASLGGMARYVAGRTG